MNMERLQGTMENYIIKMLITGILIFIIPLLSCNKRVTERTDESEQKKMAQNINSKNNKDIKNQFAVLLFELKQYANSPAYIYSSKPYGNLDSCEAYKRIVDLGQEVIPQIVEELNKGPSEYNSLLSKAYYDILGEDYKYKEQ